MRTKYIITLKNEIVSSFDMEIIKSITTSNNLNIDLIESEEIEDEIQAEKEFKSITPMYLMIVLEQMNLLNVVEKELAKPENRIQQMAFQRDL